MKRIIVLLIMIIVFISSISSTVVYAADVSSDEGGVIDTNLTVNSDDELFEESIYYTVQFNTAGGFYTVGGTNYYTVPNQTILEGDLVSIPPIIKRHGYVFQYWALSDGTEWDFDTDLVDSDVVLTAIWRYNVNRSITNPNSHLTNVFPGSSNWIISNSISTQNVRGGEPVEAGAYNSGTTLNYDDELALAIQLSGVSSTYGGCGPIALIGILDYLSRTSGYRSLLSDPFDYHERVRLANLTLQNTNTYEIGWAGNKSTFTSPGDYKTAFNTMIAMGNLSSQLSITEYGVFSSNTAKHTQIRNSINNGMPVTIWTFAHTGDGLSQDYVNYHYFTLYGYTDYEGLDSEGNSVTKTLYNARMNWGHNYIEYVDADVFTGLWGVFVYNETYQPQLIQPSDYGYPSQYHFYEIQQEITLANGFSFMTNRLRTGYVWSYLNDVPDQRYLVLSAKRLNAGTAFLQYQFTVPVKAINFDISLWSGNEGLSWINDSVRLEYKDSNGNWILAKEFYNNQYSQLSTNRAIPDNHYITFGLGAYEIRFIVECSTPSGSRNYGRVVIGDITILY